VTESEAPEFQVRQEQQQDTVIVRASGELDAFSTDRLAEHLDAAAEATQEEAVLLDLTGITYLSSAGVATLVLHTQRYAEHGRRLCVVADHPAVLRTIELTGADKAIVVVPTLDGATGDD
jgi:anti-anti-sigma factor